MPAPTPTWPVTWMNELQVARHAVPELGERRQVGLVADGDDAGRKPEPRLHLRADRDLRPAQVRRPQQGPQADVDQARHGDADADDSQLVGLGPGEGLAGQRREVVQHLQRRVLAEHPRAPGLEAHRAGQVLDARGEAVDRDLEAERDRRAGDDDRRRRTADGGDAAGVGALANEAELVELGDEARDRALVEAGVGRDARPRDRAGRRDVPQHDAEIGATDDGRVDPRRHAAPVPAETMGAEFGRASNDLARGPRSCLRVAVRSAHGQETEYGLMLWMGLVIAQGGFPSMSQRRGRVAWL